MLSIEFYNCYVEICLNAKELFWSNTKINTMAITWLRQIKPLYMNTSQGLKNVTELSATYISRHSHLH